MAWDNEDTKKPKFFDDVHTVAQEHGVLAYIVVGVVRREDSLAVATGAGSRLNEQHEATLKVLQVMKEAFDEAIVAMVSPDGTPSPGNNGGLLN